MTVGFVVEPVMYSLCFVVMSIACGCGRLSLTRRTASPRTAEFESRTANFCGSNRIGKPTIAIETLWDCCCVGRGREGRGRPWKPPGHFHCGCVSSLGYSFITLWRESSELGPAEASWRHGSAGGTVGNSQCPREVLSWSGERLTWITTECSAKNRKIRRQSS